MPTSSRRAGRTAALGPPTPLTPLIGRLAEIEEARRLLESTRLLTLTGPGGSGKTRIAVELARAGSAELEGGAAWVDLAGLSDPELVPVQVLTDLGLSDAPREGGPVEALIRVLAGQPSLLVLDNCEHLVDACARLAEALLAGCPELRMLTTSREALGIAAEQVWLVPPLSLPPCDGSPACVEQALCSEAVQLFVDRARAVVRDFTLIEGCAPAVCHVVRRLDGLPLAIELAAARVKVLSPAEIAERLDDVFQLLTTGGRTALARHRTLLAAIAWSHDLLTAEERALFRRLAVFADGFTLEAAEAVGAGGPVERGRVLDLLAALVDKSLLVRAGGWPATRYRLLETLRRFARVRLEESGELEERTAAFARHCLEVAERAAPAAFGGGRGSAAMERLVAEEGNLRAALAVFLDAGDAEAALRLAAAKAWLWFTRGEFGVGRQRIEAALALVRPEGGSGPGDLPAAIRGRALAVHGSLIWWQGEAEEARGILEEARSLIDPAEDPWWGVMARVSLATAHNLAGDHDPARRLLDEAREIALGLGPTVLSAIVHYHFGIACVEWGEPAAGRANLLYAIAIGREIGNRPSIGHPTAVLGQLEHACGRTEEAVRHLTAALAVLHEMEDRWSLVQVVETLGRIAAERGEPARAAWLLGAGRRIRDDIAAVPLWLQRQGVEAAAERLRAELGAAAFEAEWRGGASAPIERVVAEALAFGAGVAGGVAGPPAAEAAAGEGAAAGEPAAAEASGTAAGGPLPALRVLALGPLEVTVGGARVTEDRWGSARARDLLLLLMLRGARSRDEIVEALWPEAPPDRGRNALHQTVHRLRKALGDARWVVTEGSLYQLAPDAPRELDSARFEVAARAALAACAAGAGDPAALRAALALYRGPFLAGCDAGEWALETRDRLERLHQETLSACAGALIAVRDLEGAAAELERLIALDGVDEAAHRSLMLCLARLGRRSQALQLFRRLEGRLDEELGVEPEPETLELLGRIQSGARL